MGGCVWWGQLVNVRHSGSGGGVGDGEGDGVSSTGDSS